MPPQPVVRIGRRPITERSSIDARARATGRGGRPVKPAAFTYHAPTTTAEAVALLASLDGDVKPLAGGQSLVPLLALRLTHFDHLVDLNRVDDLVGVTRRQRHRRGGAP